MIRRSILLTVVAGAFLGLGLPAQADITPLITDPAGDTTRSSRGIELQKTDEPNLDILSGDIALSTDATAIEFSMTVAAGDDVTSEGVLWVFKYQGVDFGVGADRDRLTFVHPNTTPVFPRRHVECWTCSLVRNGNTVTVTAPIEELEEMMTQFTPQPPSIGAGTELTAISAETARWESLPVVLTIGTTADLAQATRNLTL